MIISITGTPATGKTTVAKLLAEKLGWKYVSLNDVANELVLFKGYDKKRKCEIVDLKKIELEVMKLSTKANLILDAHYSHTIPNDLSIVLKTEIAELKKRMGNKEWWKEKIEENIEAEIMDICKTEALELGRRIFEVDTSWKNPEDTVKEIMDFMEREGFIVRKDLKLPKDLIQIFREPHGYILKGPWKDVVRKAKKLVEDKEENALIITVGDPTSYYFIKNSFRPNVIIIDGMEKRKPFKPKIEFDSGVEKINTKNPAGIISLDLWKTVEDHVGKKRPLEIFVKGEEDLAVLPCIIFAPLGSYIFYGQFNNGTVCIELTKEKKDQGLRLMKMIVERQ